MVVGVKKKIVYPFIKSWNNSGNISLPLNCVSALKSHTHHPWLHQPPMNHIILNSGKCKYLIISKNVANKSIELGKKNLHAQAEQKLLGIITDKDLNFQNHTKSIIKAANQKLSALVRVAP